MGWGSLASCITLNHWTAILLLELRLYRYTLKNSNGMVVQVIELGATMTSILVPDKHGEFDDVTAGFDTVAGEC